MSQSTQRHHRRREESQLRIFLRAYRFEIVWLAVVALGVFLIFERMNIRATLFGWLRRAIEGVSRSAGRLGTIPRELLAHLSLSDLVGLLLILGALAAILWRLRWRLMRSPALAALACPKCGGSIHRIHRHRFDRLISLYLPVRRYHCSNSACRWHGLRVVSSHGPTSKTRIAQPSSGS